MAKKNTLREVKGFGSTETKIQNLYAYSEDWEVGKGAGNSWGYFADGGLQECLEALSPDISTEVKTVMKKELGLGKQAWSEDLLKELEKRVYQKRVEIISICLQVGEYEGKGWQLRSQRTQEQCEWLAKKGYPIVNKIQNQIEGA